MKNQFTWHGGDKRGWLHLYKILQRSRYHELYKTFSNGHNSRFRGPMSPCEFNQCKGRTAGFFRETVQANQNSPSCKRTAFQPNHSEFLVRKQEFLERIRKQDSGSPSCVWIHSLVSSTAQPLDQSQYKCYQYSN